MLEHSSPQGIRTERSHIRLVDELRRGSSIAAPPSPPPNKAKDKAKKKANQAIPDETSNGGARAEADGKDKAPKPKGSKALARQLQGMQEALTGLRQRLESLGGDQAGQAAANARLARRLDAIDEEIRSRAGRQDALQGRIDTLTETVTAHSEDDGQAVAVHEIGLGLERVGERIAKAESRLAALSGQEGQGAALAARLADIQGRIAAATRLLETQGERIARLEQTASEVTALRDGQETLTQGQHALEGELGRLRDSMQRRVETLSTDLDALRTRSETGTVQDAAATRLRRLRRDRSSALAVAALVVLSVLGLGWWQLGGLGMDQAPASSPRIAEAGGRIEGAAPVPAPVVMPPGLQTALERITDRLEQLQSTDPAAPYTADLLDRLGRLETGMTDLSRALSRDGQRGEDLSERLAGLLAAQQDLDRRLDALEQQDAGTDKGIALLDARIDRLVQTKETATGSSAADGVFVVGGSGAYGVQLVVYESSRRVAPFVAGHGLGGEARSIETRVNGRTGHAVLLGPYDSESQAAAALAGLAPDLRALRPWIRALPPGTRLLAVR